ncbi:hypothetical protein DPMN_162432 [Dreissena polymorpha]|uniref:Uncharacterized protein n=1 Tax=Dreissena polymorpha TaxID=45954 RepID=A0A9D4ITP4_DREPO|nr:hypothetical protein DPMN_162432 [Dreissena polymorpha]
MATSMPSQADVDDPRPLTDYPKALLEGRRSVAMVLLWVQQAIAANICMPKTATSALLDELEQRYQIFNASSSLLQAL